MNFYQESQAIRETVMAMQRFLLRHDFERSVFHGPEKQFAQVPEKFERAWEEYRRDWANVVTSVVLKNADLGIWKAWSRKTMTFRTFIADRDRSAILG